MKWVLPPMNLFPVNQIEYQGEGAMNDLRK